MCGVDRLGVGEVRDVGDAERAAIESSVSHRPNERARRSRSPENVLLEVVLESKTRSSLDDQAEPVEARAVVPMLARLAGRGTSEEKGVRT